MKILIDTNVILDMLFNRKGCEDAKKVFLKLETDENRNYITASAVTDLFYIIRKESRDIDKTYELLGNIFKLVSVLAVTENDILETFGKKWKDFEDCVQFTIAQNSKMNFIITNNKKDYLNAAMPVLSPQEFLEKVE